MLSNFLISASWSMDCDLRETNSLQMSQNQPTPVRGRHFLYTTGDAFVRREMERK